MSTTVAIVQRRMTHYRVPLFERMKERLAVSGIKLRVLHGEPTVQEASKLDGGTLAWAERLPTRYLADGRICWQPYASRVRDCDLVIVTQENKLVNNLGGVLNHRRGYRLAFWGHGGNLQSRDPDSWVERFKRWTTGRVDWWFAYTDLSAQLVESAGFSPARTTVLNNSIDTARLWNDVQAASAVGRPALRRELGLEEGPCALFIGSLYADKRLDLLVETGLRLRALWPNFQLLVAGAGPEREWLENQASSHSWLRYFGTVHGLQKAKLLCAADLILHPGPVGLSILDGFVAGLPMVTSDCGTHGPEIAYLRQGFNGLMTPVNAGHLADAVDLVLRDVNTRESLIRGASESRTMYSLEQMVERFCGGIQDCLVNR